MNIVCKITVVAALVVTSVVSTLAALPADARSYYHPRQYAHANHLSHRAYVAASRGHYRVASRLSHHAMRIRRAARHGY